MGTPYLTKANFTLSEAHHFAKVLATNTNPASVQAAIICRFNPPERSDLSRGALCHLQSINDEILDTFELEVTGTRVDMINARETYRRSLALHLNMPEETPLHDLLVQSHRPWDWATYVYEKLTYGYGMIVITDKMLCHTYLNCFSLREDHQAFLASKSPLDQ